MALMLALINVEHLVKAAGYPLLVLIVMGESSGVPLPGETALIAAALLASSGKLEIELVIALAAAGAIAGDNIGYIVARRAGRWLLERPGRFERQRREVLIVGEQFFERHGPKAVFFGRFILGLRTWASWLAGATRMPWRSFVLWNALGGICWATAVGLIIYFAGSSAKSALETFGIYGLGAAVVAIVSALVVGRRYRRRRHEGPAKPAARGHGKNDEAAEAAASRGSDPGRPRER